MAVPVYTMPATAEVRIDVDPSTVLLEGIRLSIGSCWRYMRDQEALDLAKAIALAVGWKATFTKL